MVFAIEKPVRKTVRESLVVHQRAEAVRRKWSQAERMLRSRLAELHQQLLVVECMVHPAR